MRRTVSRQWTGTRRVVAEVSTRHPSAGMVPRGTIRALPSQDWRGRWQLHTYDHYLLDVVAGDYLDAEAALLDATAEMDEER